jgi:hypothetical protein
MNGRNISAITHDELFNIYEGTAKPVIHIKYIPHWREITVTYPRSSTILSYNMLAGIFDSKDIRCGSTGKFSTSRVTFYNVGAEEHQMVVSYINLLVTDEIVKSSISF